MTGEDALSLLKILAERDAKLARTIVDAASELLGTVEPSGLAGTVQHALEALQPEDVWDRSGQRRDRYVEPAVAAWEVFEKALEPFRRDVEKYRKLGRIKEAAASCQGILQGLHDFEKESQTEYQDWAAEAPAEYFGEMLDVWKKLYRGRPPLTQMRQFIEDRCPDYAPWALAHLKPRKRRAK